MRGVCPGVLVQSRRGRGIRCWWRIINRYFVVRRVEEIFGQGKGWCDEVWKGKGGKEICGVLYVQEERRVAKSGVQVTHLLSTRPQTTGVQSTSSSKYQLLKKHFS